MAQQLTAELAAIKDELRDGLKAINARLDKIEKTTTRTAKTATDIADAVSWSNLLQDLLLCGICLTVSFGFVRFDKWRGDFCRSVPAFTVGELCKVSTPQPVQPPQASTQLMALRQAIVQQESSGQATLVNSLSGAAGLSQIMPENLPGWSKAALGKEITMQEYMNNPDLQLKITDHKLGEYLNTAKGKTGDESEQIKLVACWWYSGPGGNCGSTRAEAGGHPSISDYANEVLERYRTIPKGNPTATGQWRTPAPGAELSYWQEIRRRDPVTGQITNYCHNGLDLAAPVGTPIVAADSGTVAFSGWHTGGYGNLIILRHSNGLYSLYGHNESLKVSQGQQVTAGQTVALMGSTGHSSGPHLHWTVFNAEGDSQPVNHLPDKWGVKSYGKGAYPADCSRRTNVIALVK